MSNQHNPIRKPRPTSRPAAPVLPFQPSGLRLGLLLLLLLTVMAPCARSQTPPGADTLATLIDSTICDSQLPFHWRSHTITYSMLRPDTARQNLFVSLTDTVGADSTLTLNLHINPTYHFHRYDEIFEGDTLFVHDTFLLDAGTYLLPGTSSRGCDSNWTLFLTVHHRTLLDSSICDSQLPFVWNGAVFRGSGTHTALLTATDGLDSQLVMHVTVFPTYVQSLYDTVCSGTDYYWNGTLLEESGTYDLPFKTVHHCDSILRLHLTVHPKLNFTIIERHECSPHGRYRLIGMEGSAFYSRWESSPPDTSLLRQAGRNTVNVRPSVMTQYKVTSGYGPQLACPVQDSITLYPIIPVTASVQVTPEYLTYENLTFRAQNRSTGHNWCRWYINGQEVGSGSHITHTSTIHTDTVRLALSASNYVCHDSTSVAIPLIKSTLYLPNIFTPGQQSNSLFQAVGTGIRHFELWIYTRAGQLVFHSADMAQGWDGTHQGTPCPSGAYVYKCRYTDSVIDGFQHKTGTLLLQR